MNRMEFGNLGLPDLVQLVKQILALPADFEELGNNSGVQVLVSRTSWNELPSSVVPCDAKVQRGNFLCSAIIMVSVSVKQVISHNS